LLGLARLWLSASRLEAQLDMYLYLVCAQVLTLKFLYLMAGHYGDSRQIRLKKGLS
jgi:hypothetical protein